MTASTHARRVDFAGALPAGWEIIPGPAWRASAGPGGLRLDNDGPGNAETYQRCCALPGDTLRVTLDRDAPRRGRLAVAILAGFEYARVTVDLETGELAVLTHEFHKPQPRAAGRLDPAFAELALVRESCPLPGLDYEGSRLILLADGREVLRLDAIDLLPECLTMLGLAGPGTVTVRAWELTGPSRPRPEHVTVGIWQQGIKPTTPANVDALLTGVRAAAEAGVELLVTPETSLTGLRPGDPELADESAVQAELDRFRRGLAAIPGAPFTLIGYPAWIDGRTVTGAELDHVKVNCHRFVRPDGTLGPPMAKVHSCEEGLWHGRDYHLQRVAGVEVAVGVCHDARYADVWTTGVMGGARLCLHPASGGTPRGSIHDLRRGMADGGRDLDAYWVHVNAGGGSAIVYPTPNATVRDTLLATPADLTENNPAYPDYAPMGDQLAAARIRLWDATGCWPNRTLRAGRAYAIWRQLVPELVEV